MVRRPPPGLARLGFVLALLAGCSPKSTLVPPLPPETTLFVRGPVDTVSHLVHLYWFGSDPDGEVVAFELRFLNPAAPADSQWVRTIRTDSTFTVYAPAGYTMPVFEVRAIDDDAQPDPTPARQLFQFSNQAPTVRLQAPPTVRDSTFASLTLTWLVDDPDGDVTKTRLLVYLDSAGVQPRDLGAARIAGGGSLTIPSDDFKVGGQYVTGYRTVYVMPVDDGGRAGAVDSARWFVRAPYAPPGTRAQLLIVDDVPSSQGNDTMWDTLYANTALRNLAAGNTSVIRPQFNPALFRSSRDVEQTFALFDAVIWYRGEETGFWTRLRDYQDGVATYVTSGGRLFLEGSELVEGVGATGPLTLDFVQRYLDSDFLYKAQKPPVTTDSTVSWGISNARILRSPLYDDSLRMNAIYGGLRGFAVRDTHHVMLWARAGTLTQPHNYDIPIALSVPQSGGGRLLLTSLPLARANRTFTGGTSQNTARFVAKIYRDLGLIP